MGSNGVLDVHYNRGGAVLLFKAACLSKPLLGMGFKIDRLVYGAVGWEDVRDPDDLE